MKISPKPARIAPTDRVLPFAITQRKAPTPRMGLASGCDADAKTEQRHHPRRRGRSERRTHDDPDRLREGDESGADEADDGEGCGGRGLNRHREERAECHRAESAGNESLERAAQRVAGKAFQTFGEVVDSEQEQAESTQ